MKILILSPSLKESENISGISSLTKVLIDNNPNVEYKTFLVGKKDSQKRNLKWMLYLIFLPFRFINQLLTNSVDLVHFNIGFEPFSLVRDFSLFIVSKIFGKRVVLHVHGGRFVLNYPNNKIMIFIIGFFLKYSSRIVVLSECEKESLLKYYDIPNNKIIVLPNVIELGDQDCLNKKMYNTKLSLLYLGRLDENKGLKEIVEVLNILSQKKIDFFFRVCGSGPQKDSFLRDCKSIIGNNLMYEGIVFGKSKEDVLNKSQVFLLPSYFEGLPMSLLESMAYGVVPVVTPVGSIPEVVKNGNNGFIVRTVTDIVEVITKIESDRELLKQTSYKAYETIKLNYSVDKYIDRINVVYNEAR